MTTTGSAAFAWHPDPDVETSTRCSCGTLVTLARSSNPYATVKNTWVCQCLNCVDGAPDAGPGGSISGYGATPGEALWAWQDRHDEVHEVEWTPTDLFAELSAQQSTERQRTRGWILDSGGGYGPGIVELMEQARAGAGPSLTEMLEKALNEAGIDPAERGAW
jgi:hypothetical protein